MARREFTVRDIVEIFEHWQTGRSIRAIARSLGLDRNTVRKYVRAAEDAGYTPGVRRSPEEWAEFVRQRFPRAADDRLRSSSFTRVEPYREQIQKDLAEVGAVSIVWQRLRDEAGLDVSLSTFRRYVQAALPGTVSPADVVIWRPEVPPGEEVQVDFGRLGIWRDPVTGKRRMAYAFIMVLAYSRHMFVRVVFSLDSRMWLTSHVVGLEFLGGVPRRVVLDNLADGVLKPDIYDPRFNRAYAELALHYGFLIDPCRSGHPTDKPRVERGVRYVRDNFWRGRNFLSPDEANREAVRWCLEVAGRRIHGTTRQRPLELFEREERQHLFSLPAEPWEMREWTTAKVAPDAHCHVAKALYSVPWRLIGSELSVCVKENTVQFFKGEEIVKTHPRVPPGKRQTDFADLPEDRIAFFQRTPQWCLRRAGEMGPHVREAVAQVLSVNTLYNLRQAQGILRLEEKYGARRLEAACERALAYGDPRYRTVKNILANGMDGRPIDIREQDGSRSVGAFLHGQQHFALPAAGGE
ncbi:MAG: IS21 family transposase [Bacillota bacterium]|nr:IS21 family transposase [Bacillota bacterium]